MFDRYDKLIVRLLLAAFCLLHGNEHNTIVESFTFKVLPQNQLRIHHHHEAQHNQLSLPIVCIPTKTNHRNVVVLAVQVNGENQIISPFDITAQQPSDDDGNVSTTTTTTGSSTSNEILDLTWENVELVLDGMRHYLIQDGGNVIIDDIDGPIVKLQLQGACGTCPSSTQTMKMGLERGLKERIPEIQEVIQAMPQGPKLEAEQIEIVLDGVRPFLQVVGGTIVLDRIDGVDSIQPNIYLQMSGSSASLNSVKLEIAQRLQRHFMMSGLQIHWVE